MHFRGSLIKTQVGIADAYIHIHYEALLPLDADFSIPGCDKDTRELSSVKMPGPSLD